MSVGIASGPCSLPTAAPSKLHWTSGEWTRGLEGAARPASDTLFSLGSLGGGRGLAAHSCGTTTGPPPGTHLLPTQQGQGHSGRPGRGGRWGQGFTGASHWHEGAGTTWPVGSLGECWAGSQCQEGYWRGQLWGPLYRPLMYFLCSLRFFCSSVCALLSAAPGGVQGRRGGLPPCSQRLGHSGNLD